MHCACNVLVYFILKIFFFISHAPYRIIFYFLFQTFFSILPEISKMIIQHFSSYIQDELKICLYGLLVTSRLRDYYFQLSQSYSNQRSKFFALYLLMPLKYALALCVLWHNSILIFKYIYLIYIYLIANINIVFNLKLIAHRILVLCVFYKLFSNFAQLPG